MKKTYGERVMKHATWRMGYYKINGEKPPLEVHTHSR